MRRSASIVREDLRHHLNYAEFIVNKTETVEVSPTVDEQIARLKLRSEQVAALADQYGGVMRINLTDDVLPVAVEVTTEQRGFRAHVQLRWRSMSGSAHSLLWPHFGHEGTRTEAVDDNGIGVTVDGGDVNRLGMDYFSAFHVAACGWRLFAGRAGRPDLAS